MKAKAPTIWELESDADYRSTRSARAVVIAGWIALCGLALLLISRRMSGALTEELSWQAVAATAIICLVLVTGLRILSWRAYFDPPHTNPEAAASEWLGWAASLTLLLVAGGVSGSPSTSEGWLIWVTVLMADQWLRWRISGEPAAPRRKLAHALEKDQIQQIVRSRDSDGIETVTSSLRADFVEGQRNSTVYVGFCPPLQRTPEIVLEPLEGADAKVVQAFTHGARIDIRLAQATREPTSVSLNLVARA